MGHSSIRTTALYWKNIYQEPNNDLGPILAGKKWLENKEQPEPPPITENFPEVLGTPKPVFMEKGPVIPNKNPTDEDNSLSTPKTSKKTLKISINEISPRTPAKFSFEKKQINEQLPLITDNLSDSPKTEKILLEKIKNLEEKLNQVQAENNILTIKLVTAEKVAHQEKQRADNYYQQLKVIVRTIKQ